MTGAGWAAAIPALFPILSDLEADAVDLTPEEVRERMSGNLCRCGAYSNIIAAIRETMEAEA